MLAAWGAGWLWQQSADLGLNAARLDERWYWFPILIGGWWTLGRLNDLYHVHSSSDKLLSIKRVGMVGLTGVFIYLPASIFLPRLPSFLLFTYFMLIVLPVVILWRWAYATAFDRPPFHHRVLILGGGKRGQVTANMLRQGPGVKCDVMGYVDDGMDAPGDITAEIPLLGLEVDLPRLAQELAIHEIVVAMDRNLEDQLFQLLVDCQTQGVRVSWMPNLYETFYRQIPVEHIDAVWALHAMQASPIFGRLQRFVKRLFDLILVLFMLPLLILLLPPLAAAVRLDSPGPVFYRQIRSGRGNKPFSIFKFRTMFVDAEQDGQARWATKGDLRITRVGHLLRKARLDELPQLLNVLRGEMSLIGPRPERPEFIEELQRAIPFYRTRLMVKPGLTGWAQIHYEYGSSIEDALIKLRYDFYYVCYWSLWLDLYILFRTLGVVFRLKGM
jgi:exopolysaccharide biosynthesis polyprenyl glycosylphosphotransferase